MEEITNLYNIWYEKTKFMSGNLYNNIEWGNFVDYCKKNKDIANKFFLDLLKEPNHAVFALDEIYPNEMRYEGYNSLTDVCTSWRTVLYVKATEKE